jgi:hypothetical protein
VHKKTHISIAKALFRKLGLPKEYEKIFVKAIVEPDNWRRRDPRRKHHYLQYNTVLEYIKQARRAYINGDTSKCLWCLGIALHFIQDAFIPSPRTKRLREIHERLERKMESYKSGTLYMLNDAVNEGFKVNISSPPKFIKRTLSDIQWIYDKQYLLETVVKTSASITAAVFDSKNPPIGLHEKYIMLKKSHNKRVLKASIISLISVVTGSALMMSFITLSVLFFIIFYMIVPSLAYGKIVASDKEFYEVEEEADWYGIK